MKTLKTILKEIDFDMASESLSVKGARAISLSMKRRAPMMARKRKIAMGKKASQSAVQSRARKIALNTIRAQMKGGQASTGKTTKAERDKFAKYIKNKQGLINSLVRKNLKTVRKAEAQRLAGK
jgi:hypothetical protein